MKVIDIIPKDVMVRFELSVAEVSQIVKALDNCTITGADEVDAKSLETLNTMFTDVVKGLENATS